MTDGNGSRNVTTLDWIYKAVVIGVLSWMAFTVQMVDKRVEGMAVDARNARENAAKLEKRVDRLEERFKFR